MQGHCESMHASASNSSAQRLQTSHARQPASSTRPAKPPESLLAPLRLFQSPPLSLMQLRHCRCSHGKLTNAEAAAAVAAPVWGGRPPDRLAVAHGAVRVQGHCCEARPGLVHCWQVGLCIQQARRDTIGHGIGEQGRACGLRQRVELCTAAQHSTARPGGESWQ